MCRRRAPGPVRARTVPAQDRYRPPLSSRDVPLRLVSTQDVVCERDGEFDSRAPSTVRRLGVCRDDHVAHFRIRGEAAIGEIGRRDQACDRAIRPVEHIELGMECRRGRECRALQGRCASNEDFRPGLAPHSQRVWLGQPEVQRSNDRLGDFLVNTVRRTAPDGVEQRPAAHARHVRAADAGSREAAPHQVEQGVLDGRRAEAALYYEHFRAETAGGGLDARGRAAMQPSLRHSGAAAVVSRLGNASRAIGCPAAYTAANRVMAAANCPNP